MGKAYRLHLLGPVQVERAGKPVRGFESHKAVALLGYLAIHNRALTRIFLANLFWQDKSEARGRGNLSRVIHNLSSLLPDCLIADRDTIRFRCGDSYWIDTRAFEELTARGDASALTAAVELYRDEFMAGIFLDDCPDFETWLVTERERWRQRVSQVLQTLIAHHTQRGECELGLRLAARWLDLDPWREEAHRQKMHLLALNGQRGDALAQYETCRRVLAAELGVAPTQATTKLYEQIRDGALAPLPPPAVSPPHNLPAPLTPFVGRADELAKIAERLANPDCRLITLVGPGGIGKTRLALRAAMENLRAFSDGAFLVPLASISSADLIAPVIAHALKLSLSGKIDPRARLLDHLRAKSLLLVLDNYEQLRDDPTLLIEILQTAPRVKILITSRERLNLHAEWLLELEGLPYPTTGAVGGQPSARRAPDGAIELFAQSAQRVNADFLLETEWAGALQICQLTRGVPLALELAAASARDFSCAAIATEIEQNLNFLATTMRDVPGRHRSMRAVFEHSWNLLAEEERRTFARLAVFRGGFDAAAANAVNSEQSTVNSQPNTDHRLLFTDPCLTALVNKCLLRQDASGRYEMHELVRQYAEIKLDEAEEQEAIKLRHLDYFVALAERAHQQLFGSAQEMWLAQLETEHDNIRAAFEWARAHQASQAGLRLATALRRFWLTRGDWVEGMQWLEQMLALNHMPSPVRTQALNAAGNLAVSLGDYDRATALYEEALTQSRAQSDPAVSAGILNNLGLLAKMQGEYARAEEFHRASLAVRQKLGDKLGMAGSTVNLGNIFSEQGNYEQAIAFYQQSLDLDRELQDTRGAAIALTNLGNVHLHQGNFDQAKNFYTASLALSRKLNGKPAIANTLTSLGVLARKQGEYAQAATLFVEGLTLAKEIGDKHLIAVLFEAFAFLASAQGQMEHAARLLGAADALHQAIGDHRIRFDLPDYARNLAALIATLGEQGLAVQWVKGRAMSLEQAIQSALQK
ncbi:MAG: tetratricopeptide repeat protein [Anaerolineales bacterium]|nr:tetratricopeptide repeat protein [Anaerolineales bacterium]